MYGLDLKVVAIAIFPRHVILGRKLPARLCRRLPEARSGFRPKTAGGFIYAANTLGGIFGALLVSLFVIPAGGSVETQSSLFLVSALRGLLLLAPESPPDGRRADNLRSPA